MKRLNLGDDQPDTVYHLGSADGSSSTQDVMAFEGSDWTRIA
jgi:hypothetical protein